MPHIDETRCRPQPSAPWKHPAPAIQGLVEMLEFVAHDFCRMVEILDGLIRDYESDERKMANLSEAGAEHVISIFDHVRGHCKNIDLVAASDFHERTRHRINAGVSRSFVLERARAIRDLIYQDLKKRKFSYIQYHKAEILDSLAADWSKVFGRFGSIKQDAQAATEAYAFELNNACVFHSMMVLEKGLIALAKAVGADRKRNTWETIIDRIEGKIAEHLKTMKKPPPGTKPLSPRAAAARRAHFDIYAGAAKEFTYFRLAWRNHVAHGHADYDENCARKVLSHVRDFMSRISMCLKENIRPRIP
jgi:hypothetical protein